MTTTLISAFLLLNSWMQSPLELANPANITVSFELTFEGEELKAGERYYSEMLDDSLNIDLLKFYVSHLSLLQDGNTLAEAATQYKLIDFEKPGSMVMHLELNSSAPVDELRFGLGVDSATNVSGALGGDLDPTQGMYWSWQSGYINFKLEGQADKCPSRGHRFIYHLGGYLPPFQSFQTISLPVNKNENIRVRLDLAHLIQELDLYQSPNLMSPGEEAVKLSEQLARIFRIQQ